MDRNSKNIKDCGVRKNFKCDTDHRMLAVELVFSEIQKDKYKNIPDRNEKMKKYKGMSRW